MYWIDVLKYIIDLLYTSKPSFNEFTEHNQDWASPTSNFPKAQLTYEVSSQKTITFT
ncbi:MAG: hypothetical protein ACYDEC_12420 [Bacteroidia bacterium]